MKHIMRGLARTDYGIIAIAALFEEHCHKRAQPFAYQDAKNIGEDRREWSFNETLECIFAADKLAKWRNIIMEPYRLVNTFTTPTPNTMSNICCPFHLMADALAAKYVWSQILWFNLIGSSR